MASIETAIDKFEEVANAFVSLNFFRYGFYAEIGQFRDKNYPALLIENTPTLRNFEVTGSMKTYRFTLNFFDKYQRLDKAQNDSQSYQGNIELLAWQYLREVRRQLKTNSDIKIIEPITDGSYRFNAGTDQLLKYTLQVDISIWGDCTTGTFNYGT